MLYPRNLKSCVPSGLEILHPAHILCMCVLYASQNSDSIPVQLYLTGLYSRERLLCGTSSVFKGWGKWRWGGFVEYFDFLLLVSVHKCPPLHLNRAPTGGIKLGGHGIFKKPVRFRKSENNSPVTGPDGPRSFYDVKVPRFRDSGTGWW